jgi:hypothetical protein
MQCLAGWPYGLVLIVIMRRVSSHFLRIEQVFEILVAISV